MSEEIKTCTRCHRTCENGYVETINIETGESRDLRCDECDRQERVADWKKSKIITSRVWLNAAMITMVKDRSRYRYVQTDYDDLPAYHEIVASMERVQEEAKLFEREVWLAGLNKQVEQASSGLSKKVCGYEVRVLATCGRVLITIEGKDFRGFGIEGQSSAEITLITVEDENVPGRMGIQSIYATEAQALETLRRVRGWWLSATPKHRLLKADRKISVI